MFRTEPRPGNKGAGERIIAAVIASAAGNHTIAERRLAPPTNGNDMLQSRTGAFAPSANPSIAALYLTIDAAMRERTVVQV